jgi:SAM-dependent methyltransferase
MQRHAWQREYDRASLVSLGGEPSQAVKDFLKWLRRERNVDIYSMHVLDAGCGVGKNALYLAELGNTVTGLDFAENAIQEAKKRAEREDYKVTFQVGDLEHRLPLADASQDVILDVMTSNSLSEAGRENFIQECARVLKKGGYYMLRTLAKEGDKNAKNLIASAPGSTPDSYILPDVLIEESVFTKERLEQLYKDSFEILHCEKKTGYQTIGNRTFKRNYWILYIGRI